MNFKSPDQQRFDVSDLIREDGGCARSLTTAETHVSVFLMRVRTKESGID